MNKNYLNIIIASALIIIMTSCSGEKKSENSSTAETLKKQAAPVKESSDNPVLAKGETVYKSYCMACHMSKGEGVPNLNPPLTRTKYTLGDKKVMIGIVINGLDEEIEVLGKTYQNVMTPFGFLSDEEIAAVVTYVRSSFGNDADAATVEEVAAVRAAGS